MSEDATTNSNASNKNAPEYRVLARKYRPGDFSGLIGQEALVRTLTNAIQSGRLAHAFMLTGVRGVGKTTTARIIARALNCVGADGKGGPTAEPCGVCEHCISISNDNHMDVIEMDAASRTGVDDIREVIEGVRFKPVSARYKVYIIDEVHMLSKNAFNALLKTLEEPPEHVKFIFATTEIRKVPVTVLSRCQRFDLRRIDMETLSAHFKSVVAQEGASVSDEALQIISRAADGSVRDGLSLLDQAIAHTTGDVSADTVREMLGLADRTQTFELFESIFKGDAKGAVEQMETQYQSGADPLQVLQDLLDLCHWITRIKVSSDALNAPGVAEMERVKGKEMAAGLSMADLTRAWQMLLKGITETRSAPSQLQGAEMVLIRLIYGLSLPSPADALKAMGQTQAQPSGQHGSGTGASAPAPASGGGASAIGGTQTPGSPGVTHGPVMSAPANASGGASAALAQNPEGENQSQVQPQAQPQAQLQARSMSEASLPDPLTFAEVVSLSEQKGEMILHANLISNVHLVKFEPGRIEFSPADHAPSDLSGKLSKFLNDHTPRRWVVTVSRASGAATIKQQGDALKAKERADAAKLELVSAVLKTFPGAEVTGVTDHSSDAQVLKNPGYEITENAPEED